MRNTHETNGERTTAAQELSLRLSLEEMPRHEPAHRFLIASIVSFAVLVLGLASSGCTIGQTRFMLGATLVADAATTQSALSSSSNTSEGNAVLQKAPIPIMLVLSGIVSLVAEKQVRDGEIGKAKTLYRVASVVHGLAAAWNGYQMGKIGGAGSGGATVQTAAIRIPRSTSHRGTSPVRLGF